MKYVDVPRSSAKDSMIQTGMPEWQAEAVCNLLDLLRNGTMAGPSDTVQKVTGKVPITFDQFAKDHAAAFR